VTKSHVRVQFTVYRVNQGARLTSSLVDEKKGEVIVKCILNLDQSRFAPTYTRVCDMADKLLAARGAGQIGVQWPRNFFKRTDSLKTPFNRTFDRQRALCENPVLIRNRFELVE
jgi:hypothetical protein